MLVFSSRSLQMMSEMWIFCIVLLCLIGKSTGVAKYKPSAFASVDNLPSISAKEAHCIHWSRNNECIINPGVLWSQCVTDCIITSKDDNIKCFWWSDTGECVANPRYIQVHCPESCGFAIAWNPWIRKNLSIENHYSTDSLMVDRCRIPRDLHSAANMMRRRLTLYLSGHHLTEGFNDKYHDQFFTMMGMSESFLYTLRLYEIIFYYFDNTPMTELNLDRINIIYTALSSEDTDLIMRSIYGWLELIEEAHLDAGYLLANISSNSTLNTASQKNQKDFAVGSVSIAEADVSQFSNSPLASLASDTSCGMVYSHSPKVDFIPTYLSSGSNPGLFSSGSVTQYYTDLQETYNTMHDVYDELDLSGFVPSSLNSRKQSSNSRSRSSSEEFTLDTTVTLSNGVVMPVLGFGTYFLDGQTLSQAVRSALEVGYRLFDTHNNSYADAAGLGAALNAAIDHGVVTRGDLFVVSKYAQNGLNLTVENCTETIQQQLHSMGLSYFDLYLLDGRPDDEKIEAAMWQALENAYKEGWVRAIGVSNYYSYGVTILMSWAEVVPMVIQNKVDVYHIGKGIDVYGDNMLEIALYYNIVLMGYSPLSGTPFFMRPVDDPIVRYVAAHHQSLDSNSSTVGSGGRSDGSILSRHSSSVSYTRNRTLSTPNGAMVNSDITTPAQVLLRWSLQHRVVTLTQSTKKSRQQESYNALKIHPLSKPEMKLLNSIQHLVSSPLGVPIVI